MGSSASRAAGKSLRFIWPTPKQTDPLRHLPADSAVRRDAEAAAELEERRIALECSKVSLEELNRKDEQIVSMMQSAMKQPEGDIVYREHILPLAENEMVRQMVTQVRLNVMTFMFTLLRVVFERVREL
jgi:hypothetical protein